MAVLPDYVPPLPEDPPALVQAPADAGVGLEFRPRFPHPEWPSDWWQRNLDEPILDPDDPDPDPLTERQMRLPVVEVP